MKLSYLSAWTLMCACAVTQVNAQVIADNFDRTGDLNGSAPSMPQASNPSETWAATATGDFTLNSTGLLTSTGAESGSVDLGTGVADLPFTLTAGKVYDLKATINTTGGQWLAFGFQEGSDLTSNAPYIGVSPWLLLKPSQQVQVFTGPNVGGGGTYSTTAGAQDFSIVLDTTKAQWSYTAYDDGVKLQSAAFSSNPAVDHLFLESYQNTTGTFSNFALTITPEPSSAALFGAGLLGLALAMRKLRAPAR